MEHRLLREWAERYGIKLDAEKEKKLNNYAALIHETNNKFNITGFKTIDDIIENLIIASLDPLVSMNVPRGTIFADIGTGAGIPGIPLAIYQDNWKGVCIDSNSKKSSFVNSVIREYNIDHLQAVNERLEHYAQGQMRDSFDFVFSRALGELYFAVEVGAPLLKTGGLFYIYYNAEPGDLSPVVIDHVNDVGLIILERNRYHEYGIKEVGIVLIKKNKTDHKYPRNMAAIKRDIKRRIKAS